MKTIYIKWRDSMTYRNEDKISYFIKNAKVAIFETVGYLVNITNNGDYVVAREKTVDTVRGVIIIPVENIVEKRFLK